MFVRKINAYYSRVASRSYLRKPTTDLYFLNAMSDMVGGCGKKSPIKQIGVNSFCANDVAVVLRQDTTTTIRDILSRKWRKLIYVVDDDIPSGLTDPSLSMEYRKRLESQYRQFFRPMLQAADCIVTSSETLMEKFSVHSETRLLNPVWHRSPLDSLGAGGAVGRRTVIRIVHLGAMSHASDLLLILPALKQLLRDRHDVEFTSFIDLPEIRNLGEAARVKIKRMQTWNHYKRWVGSERFDLALYPVLDTPFNNARSVNKFIEHALVGAIGIYSETWTQSRKIQDRKNGFLACNTPDGWLAAMDSAIETKERFPVLFHEAARFADSLNDVATQRAFWRKAMFL